MSSEDLSMKLASELGLDAKSKIIYQPSYELLAKDELEKNEGKLSSNGTFAVDTGIFTGRSPKDKYFAYQEPSCKNIAWGKVNQKATLQAFDAVLALAKQELGGKELYVIDLLCGASKKSQKRVRFVTEVAWQAHFVKNMFIETDEKNFKPDFVIYNACKARVENFKELGLNSDVAVIFNIEKGLGVITGTWYGGEMKKGIFSLMNYFLPLKARLPMHCSANVSATGDVALFFGLSGTGKTTLSTDANRALIGDDEHGWDEEGVFNFEGGCYAKCINLDPSSEPEIYAAIRKNALLENVCMNEQGEVDYCDASKTENTRVSYPITHIKNRRESLQAGHPSNIIFLCADAFGLLPPLSLLSPGQAMYYFLSGYTAKLAGTERGIKSPVATFSACFGEPFMPLHPFVYAKLLGEKIAKHQAKVWLVNTGWTGGANGAGGKRMSIKDTRACVNAALDGSALKAPRVLMPIFGIERIAALPGIDATVLDPKASWGEDKAALYDEELEKLAQLFIDNFARYASCDLDGLSGFGGDFRQESCGELAQEIKAYGPKL